MTQRALPSAEEVDRAVAAVLARNEFQPENPSAFRRLVGEALGYVGRLLETALEALRGLLPRVDRLGGGELLAMAILVALAVGLVLLGILVARRGWLPWSRPKPPPSEAQAASPPGAREWEERARRTAAEGRWREAALALYQALLLRLDSRGLVRFDPAKTPGDYRREARGRPVAAALDAFVRSFEPLAFGGRAGDPSEWERLERRFAEASTGV